jgi:hypothetical protein
MQKNIFLIIISLFGNFCKAQNVESSTELINRFNYLVKKHHYSQAISTLDQNKSRFEKIDFYSKKSFVFYKLNDFKNAYLNMDTAIQISPNLDSLYRNRGNYKISSNDTVNGEKDLRHAFTLNKNSVYNNLYLAKYFLIQNRNDSFLIYIGNAEKINPKSKIEEYHTLKLKMNFYLNLHKWSQAKKILKQINNLIPGTYSANYSNMNYFSARGKMNKAIQYISLVITEDSNFIDVMDHCYRSEMIMDYVGEYYSSSYYSLSDLKLLRLAEEDLLDVIAKDTMHDHAFLRLANLYLMIDELPKSYYYLKQSQQFNNLDQVEIKFLKSLCLTKLFLYDSSNKCLNSVDLNSLDDQNKKTIYYHYGFNCLVLNKIDSAEHFLKLANRKNFKDFLEGFGIENNTINEMFEDSIGGVDIQGEDYYNAAKLASLVGDNRKMKIYLKEASKRGYKKAI